MQKPEKNPSTPSAAYLAMRPKWDKIAALLGGTDAMREAGDKYLPRHEQETQERYDERLKRAVLFNMTELTLESWVGRPFSDPLTVEDAPPEVEDVLEDVDLCGQALQEFARNWFSDGLAKAFSHVLVDYPVVDPAGRTREDDLREGVRPYWVLVRPEDVFFARNEFHEGRERLTEVRMWEVETEVDGFAERKVRQIRRMFLDAAGVVRVEIYRQDKPDDPDSDWSVYASWSMTIKRIPLVTFYADREGFMCGEPPMDNLADLNVAHWQSGSDQTAVLTVSRFPILAISGGEDTDKIVIGPYKAIIIPDPQGKAYYVEHTGAAIEAGRKNLLDLQDQMAEYGAEFLKKKPGSPTATARALDSAEATSPLQDVTLRFKAAVEEALQVTAEWLGLGEDAAAGTLVITTDFGPEELSAPELTVLAATRQNRDISRAAYLGELKRRGLLSDEYDPEKDAAQLEKELLDLMGSRPGMGKTEDDEPEDDDETDETEEEQE